MRSQWLAKLAAGALRNVWTGVGLMLVLLGAAGTVWAGGPPPPATPEIDPGAAMSALTLLAGSMFVLTDRLRRK